MLQESLTLSELMTAFQTPWRRSSKLGFMAECTTDTRPESVRTSESRCPDLRSHTFSAPLKVTVTRRTSRYTHSRGAVSLVQDECSQEGTDNERSLSFGILIV